MKNICIYIVLLITIFLLPNTVVSSPKSNKLYAQITIEIDDSILLHGSKVVFRMNENDINTNFPGFTKYYSKTINSKITKCLIPLSTTLNYGRIDIVNDSIFGDVKFVNLPLNNSNNLFIFENGDRVILHLTARQNGAFFTGKNAAKYSCSYKIASNNDVASLSLYNHYMNLKDYQKAYETRSLQWDSVFQVQKSILNTYKESIDPAVYQLLILDRWSECNFHIVDGYLRGVFMRKQSDQYHTATLSFKNYYSESERIPVTSIYVQAESYLYGDFLIEKAIANAVISHSNDTLNFFGYFKFKDIIEDIDSHYKLSILKDKLYLLGFLNSHSAFDSHLSDFEKYLNRIVQISGDNRFKTALIGFKNANMSGLDAFPFALHDRIGKGIRLSDFKGKLIVMDFWFTGCSGCLIMAEKLKPIIASYKKNPKIVFISVSCDRDKNLWLSSIENGKYCNQNEINLLANNGFDSKIIQYYNIDAFPSLIIISKKGKIISTSPPDPRTNHASFINFINQNINTD